VLVTHEMGFARRSADTIVFMHQGRIWEKGPPAKLFGAPATAELASFIAGRCGPRGGQIARQSGAA
jgi:polar amino acid transport system ATP-binding protein